jgi:ABC-type branched-subunit amino acid transport system substrate-binding protein
VRRSSGAMSAGMLATVAVTVGSLAACSSSGTSSGQAGGSGGPGAQNSGKTVTLMMTGTINSPAASYPSTLSGAQAAAAAINSHGGIDGAKIVIESCDDQLVPGNALDCVRKGISDHVTAFVGGVEVFGSSVYPFINEARIPWVGPIVADSSQMTNAMAFPFDGGAVLAAAEAANLAVTKGGSRVALVYHGDAGPTVFTAGFMKKAVEAAGGTVTADVLPPLTATVYSTYAQQVVDSGANAVTADLTQTGMAALIRSLRQVGFKGLITTSGSDLVQAQLKQIGPSAMPVIIASPVRDPSVDKSQAEQFLAEMSSQPASIQRDADAVESWLAVHTVADLLAGAKTLDSATLLSKLQTVSAVKTYGLLPDGVSWQKNGPLSGYPRVTNIDSVAYSWNGTELVDLGGDFKTPVLAK